MKRGVDSSTARPTAATVAAEVSTGTSLWSGYITTKPGVGVYSPWSRADFDIARQCGATPIAYCSGNDDPVALKTLAAQWNVRLCLDVESGIRGDGAWVQSFLDASGAGLYGNASVFVGRRAAFYVLAAYVSSDPGVTWKPGLAKPNGPCGWQWEGTHTEFGDSVDRGNFDDWFGGSDMTWNMDLKRAVIDDFRLAAFGPWPESLGAIDAFAVQINDDGTNVLEVLDNLRQLYQKNGGTLFFDRVVALETKVASLLAPTIPLDTDAVAVEVARKVADLLVSALAKT